MNDKVINMYTLYMKGVSIAALSRKYGVSNKVIKKLFYENNLKLKHNPNCILNDSTIYMLYEEYKSGKSVPTLNKQYGISNNLIYSGFKRLGLKTRSNKINSRIYTCDEDYFEIIDTPDKAYWLGFIYADGYITTPRKHTSQYFGIALSIIDINHLNKINKCLNSTYPIKKYTQTKSQYKPNTQYCRLLISSDKIASDLESHGVICNKTNILKPPQIKEELIRHFIRGYFDGDGSIYLNNAKSPFYSINFLGTDDMLNWIMDYLELNNLIKHRNKLKKRKPNQVVSSISFGGNQLVNKIMTHLYKDSKMFLDRKYNKYLQLQNLINSRL